MVPDPSRGLTRREFLSGALAVAALGSCRTAGREIPGELLGPNHALGHRLRTGGFPAPSKTEKTKVAIVGAGAAGLSAAWKLERSGVKDFVVLDLEPKAGGNSAWGENEVSAYPWGAHYLPLPGPRAVHVRALLREIDPAYKEKFVCHAPTERLFIHGRWQDGLFPRIGASAADFAELDRFHAEIDALRRRVGGDGRPAFAIPMELSSRDPSILALDRLSMAQWLDKNGYKSERLRWYVEYACRDDFGGRLEEVSAWAGLQYYAARGEGEDDKFLVWPEGNGFLVRKLAEIAGARVRTGALAYSVREENGGVAVDWLDGETGETRRLLASRAIVCLPRFVARRVVEPLRGEKESGFAYAPWLVANLTVEDAPSGNGAAPAWDNVLYASEGLGYVDATHQGFSLDRRRAVWTYYRPLTGDPDARRREARDKDLSYWRELCLADLERALPGLRAKVKRLDAWVWGHGMVLPRPGFVWSDERRRAAEPRGAIHFAHSDLSGYSIFEEANYRGVVAAEQVLSVLS